ncbi:CHRD domain [Fragilaria crotonensis]|nr:CHRD domain [Fragilaria crotonensis]
MNVLAIIQLLVAATLFTTTTTATDINSVRGARQLTSDSVITYSQIKLTQGNEVSPFIGVPFATGIATVKLDFKPSRTNAKWKVCIQTNIIGFTPGLLHVHKGKISENGGAVVDFSDMLGSSPTFSGCVSVAQSLYNDIKDNPLCVTGFVLCVNAHVAGDPTSLFNRAIRGQVLQKFRTKVVPSEEVSPFKGKSGASGFATVSFENAGKAICIDATITGFNPVLAHLHNAKSGSNGAVVVNFTSKKVATGRFLGCGTLSELGVTDSSLASKILANPSSFYFNFHLGNPDTSDFNVAIRGQLEY